MDLNAYLQRIGVTATGPTPSLAALRQLHRQHVLSVPFESLSIHCGEKIILDPALLYQKIVERRRGGFCYENNGVFLWVLRTLGYEPRILTGGVRNRVTGVYGPPYDHMILSVELEGRRWLCDVGFGEGISAPLPLEAGWEEEQDGCVFRLRVEGGEWFLEKKEGEGWRGLYKFTLEERRFEDFKERCEYHQTSPGSVFFCKSFCSLLLPRGRVTYTGHRLTTTRIQADGSAEKTTRSLADEEIPGVLRDTFGIVLSGKLVPKDDDIEPPSSG